MQYSVMCKPRVRENCLFACILERDPQSRHSPTPACSPKLRWAKQRWLRRIAGIELTALAPHDTRGFAVKEKNSMESTVASQGRSCLVLAKAAVTTFAGFFKFSHDRNLWGA